MCKVVYTILLTSTKAGPQVCLKRCFASFWLEDVSKFLITSINGRQKCGNLHKMFHTAYYSCSVEGTVRTHLKDVSVL